MLWNEQSVGIFTHDGEYLIDYPRPSMTGLYYGPRTARQGTPMKTAGQNPSAGITATAQRSVSKGGYVGVLASKSYAAYKRSGQQVTITWDATTVTPFDISRNTHRHLRQAHSAPRRARTHPSTAVHEVLRHARVHDVLRHESARSPETSHGNTATSLPGTGPVR